MSEALRTMATRTPGRYVPHWTDRPTVAADFLPVWNSFCGLAAWLGTTSPAEHVPAAVDTWIERHFWRESPSGKAVLVDVFLELLWLRRDLMRPQEAAE